MLALLIVLGILLAILMLRLSLVAEYGQYGAVVYAKIGPKKVMLYPVPQKAKGAKEKPPKPDVPEPEEKGGKLDQLKAVLSIIRPAMEQVKRRLLIRKLILHYTAATEDAAMTALVYGSANAAVSMLLPMLTYNFRVKEQDIRIDADFDSKEHRVYVKLVFSLAVWEGLYLALTLGRLLVKSGLTGSKTAKQAQQTV